MIEEKKIDCENFNNIQESCHSLTRLEFVKQTVSNASKRNKSKTSTSLDIFYSREDCIKALMNENFKHQTKKSIEKSSSSIPSYHPSAGGGKFINNFILVMLLYKFK